MMLLIQLHASAGIGTERTGRARSAAPRSPAAARSCRRFRGRFRLMLRCPACPVSRLFRSGPLLRCRSASYCPPPWLFLRHPLCAVPLPACPPPGLRGKPLRIPGGGRGPGRRSGGAYCCSGFPAVNARRPRCRVFLSLPAPIPTCPRGLRAYSLATPGLGSALAFCQTRPRSGWAAVRP